ncbi:MAG: type II toxin-antitoxin system VapC family toxin [Actinomycetota bacterium]|nr:type II toxin-antitoxin system VapC family toxin [Actinomycetota bacterium]
MTFLDASVLLAAEDLDDPHHDASVALLTTGVLSTLDLAIYEITNVAELRWRDRSASLRLRDRVWAIAELGVLIRVDQPLADRAAELVRHHDLSAYDAAYVAGAERLGVPLASCDERDLISRGLARAPADLLSQLRAEGTPDPE